MDGCSCHRSVYLYRLLDEKGIVVVPLPVHSSRHVQALDLGIFVNHKSAQSGIHLPTEMSKQTQQVIRAVSSAFQTIAHPDAITSAFSKAGITPVFRDGRLFVTITPWTAARVRNLPDEYSQAPSVFRLFDKTRIEIANLDFQAGRHEHDESVYGYIEDLPCVPGSPDNKESVQAFLRDFPELLSHPEESSDESDDEFLPEPEQLSPRKERTREQMGGGKYTSTTKRTVPRPAM